MKNGKGVSKARELFDGGSVVVGNKVFRLQ